MVVKTIREIRLAKEMTQEQMAEICGVHVNTYINWEKNPEKIPIGKANILCREGLNVDICDVSFCSNNLQNVE